MSILNGIKVFLQFVNDNWTMIIVIIGLGIATYKKVKAYFSKSNEEKIDIAKKQLQEIILKLVTEAEIDYGAWVTAGAIKRSQVIEQIFLTYPILSYVVDQESLISWIDELIDDALETMREIISNNSNQSNEDDDGTTSL